MDICGHLFSSGHLSLSTTPHQTLSTICLCPQTDGCLPHWSGRLCRGISSTAAPTLIIMIHGSRGMGTTLPDYDRGCPKGLSWWLGDWQRYEHHLLVNVDAGHLQATHNNRGNALCNSKTIYYWASTGLLGSCCLHISTNIHNSELD